MSVFLIHGLIDQRALHNVMIFPGDFDAILTTVVKLQQKNQYTFLRYRYTVRKNTIINLFRFSHCTKYEVFH